MLTRVVEYGVLSMVILTTLLWQGLLPAEMLLRAIGWLLAWSALSVLLVGSAGAWVALRRAHRPLPARR